MTEVPTRRSRPAASKRGRKPAADPRKHFISVRCNSEEYLTITVRAARAGLTAGAFLRQRAVGSAGPGAIRRPTPRTEELSRILGQLGKIGSNLNQIAKAYNSRAIMPGLADILAARREVGEMHQAVMKALGRDHQG